MTTNMCMCIICVHCVYIHIVSKSIMYIRIVGTTYQTGWNIICDAIIDMIYNNQEVHLTPSTI